MNQIELRTVAADEAEVRLDRWFRRHFPTLAHGRLEKLLRTGQVRVDGKRAKGSDRLAAGQQVRVPPLSDLDRPAPKAAPRSDPREAEALRRRVLYRDAEVIGLDKPAGLAVQGGTKTEKHLDGMLDALAFEAAERPRLVHRLDRDTSGVILLARTVAAAGWLTRAFARKETTKVYLAVTVGVPKPREGRIDAPLAKLPGRAGERVAVDAEEGRRAVTEYVVLDQIADRAALVACRPVTGRTHQIRAHLAALGTPILGDGKYGGAAARLEMEGVARQLHLHARAIRLTAPSGRPIAVEAPLPPHFRQTLAALGLDGRPRDPFL
ncbi:MAG: RluA family pseudouridine synthase [Thalassobaculales bacterium]